MVIWGYMLPMGSMQAVNVHAPTNTHQTTTKAHLVLIDYHSPHQLYSRIAINHQEPANRFALRWWFSPVHVFPYLVHYYPVITCVEVCKIIQMDHYGCLPVYRRRIYCMSICTLKFKFKSLARVVVALLEERRKHVRWVFEAASQPGNIDNSMFQFEYMIYVWMYVHTWCW